MSARAPLIGFVITLTAGLALLGIVAARDKTGERLALGVPPAQVMAILQREGDEVCQQPLPVPAHADRARVVIAPSAEIRGPVTVSLRRTTGTRAGRVVSQGVIPRRRLTGRPADVKLNRTIKSNRDLALCVKLDGGKPLEVWGQQRGDGNTTPSSGEAYQYGKPLGGDLYAEFPRASPASRLSALPQAFSNAAPYKLGGMGSWAYWGLGGLLIAAMVALGIALSRASRP